MRTRRSGIAMKRAIPSGRRSSRRSVKTTAPTNEPDIEPTPPR